MGMGRLKLNKALVLKALERRYLSELAEAVRVHELDLARRRESIAEDFERAKQRRKDALAKLAEDRKMAFKPHAAYAPMKIKALIRQIHLVEGDTVPSNLDGLEGWL